MPGGSASSRGTISSTSGSTCASAHSPQVAGRTLTTVKYSSPAGWRRSGGTSTRGTTGSASPGSSSAATPQADAGVTDPNHLPHPRCLGAEARLSKKATDEAGCFRLVDVEIYQAVAGMTRLSGVEIRVEREQRWTSETVEQRKDL